MNFAGCERAKESSRVISDQYLVDVRLKVHELPGRMRRHLPMKR